MRSESIPERCRREESRQERRERAEKDTLCEGQIAGSFTTSGGRCQSDIKKLLLTQKHSFSPPKKHCLQRSTLSPPKEALLNYEEAFFLPPSKKHCLLRSTLSPPRAQREQESTG